MHQEYYLIFKFNMSLEYFNSILLLINNKILLGNNSKFDFNRISNYSYSVKI